MKSINLFTRDWESRCNPEGRYGRRMRNMRQILRNSKTLIWYVDKGVNIELLLSCSDSTI